MSVRFLVKLVLNLNRDLFMIAFLGVLASSGLWFPSIYFILRGEKGQGR